MKEQVSVSIIVPVYRAEFFLKESIYSILNQTYRDFELILVNDGSPDKSGLVCDELASYDKRVRVCHKENGGQSSARNVGIEMARGKYIGFVDNDDFVYPDMCERLFKNAEKHGADISACSYIVKNEHGQVFHNSHTLRFYELNNRQGVEAFLSREFVDIYVWTKFYRKDFLDKFNIRFEEGRSEEDFLFNYQAFIASKFTVMEDVPIYIYIERQESTCRTFCKNNLRKYLDDTCYRLKKIENGVSEQYPEFTFLAKIQTVKYCFRMIFILSKFQFADSKGYYNWIKNYLHSNSDIVIKKREHWGLSLIGCLFAVYLPPYLYFVFKKWRHRNESL